MFYLKKALLILTCCLWLPTGLGAAEFYFSKGITRYEKSWQDMALIDRLTVLTQEGTFLSMEGPITPGDYNALTKIHALVPIHTLKISSLGGSVAEALKIADFVNRYLIEVTTDWSCEDRGRPNCGCVSSCAFIWLAAPVRISGIVKTHRPYFNSDEFHKLPDAVALQQYNEASSKVQSLLQSKGYSQEFIAGLFRIPREQVKQLTHQEMASLPIDVALDELLSARCYRGNEQQLRNYAAMQAEIRRLEKARDKLIAELPQHLTGYELERDPTYSKDYAILKGMWRRLEGFQLIKTNDVKELEKAYYEFKMCKSTERRQASIRRSGQRLTPEVKSKLLEFTAVVGDPGMAAARQEIAKYIPDHLFGRQAAEELKEREDRLRTLKPELQRMLPAAHLEFISEALK